MPRARLVPVTALAAVAVLGACSSGTKQSAPTTTITTAITTTTVGASTTVRASVAIVSLTGPQSPVTCNAPTQVQLHWTTRGAIKVELRIDSGPVFSRYPGGKRDPLVPLACDANPHTYELLAHAANGDTATKSLTIAERGLVT